MTEGLPDDLRRVVGALALKARRARSDPSEFFSFVMRHEKTNEPLKIAPHQRLIYEFIAAHPLCVIRAPTGTSKTVGLQALFMRELGLDPTIRGAVISGKQGQAGKVIRTVSEYIEESAELQLVFPNLARSSRAADPWTQTQITVERPVHSRDASLVAIGYGERIPGTRLSWILIDDILNAESTATPEGRRKLNAWVHSTVLSRRDNEDLRVCVTNVPWHPGVESTDSSGEDDDVGDLTFALARLGWPVLNMDITGDIWFENTDWDTDLVRPSTRDNVPPVKVRESSGPDDHRVTDGKMYRLTAHDSPAYGKLAGAAVPNGATEWVDIDNEVYLWPEVITKATIEHERRTTTTLAFEQSRMIRVRSDMTSIVKESWIDGCKQAARLWTPPIRSLHTGKWTEPYPTITGIDPAFSQKKTADQSSIFTFAVYPNGFLRILNIKFGRWSSVTLLDNIVADIVRFNSIAYVEDNGAQKLLVDMALARSRSIPVRGLTTGKNKRNAQIGIEAVFVGLENAAWLIPNDGGRLDPDTAEAVRQALFYTRSRKVHTGDVLMSWWIAREGARRCGFLKPGAVLQANPSVDAPSGPTLNQILSR